MRAQHAYHASATNELAKTVAEHYSTGSAVHRDGTGHLSFELFASAHSRTHQAGLDSPRHKDDLRKTLVCELHLRQSLTWKRLASEHLERLCFSLAFGRLTLPETRHSGLCPRDEGRSLAISVDTFTTCVFPVHLKAEAGCLALIYQCCSNNNRERCAVRRWRALQHLRTQTSSS